MGLLNKHWRRLCGATLLAIYILVRPVSDQEPIPRDDLVAMNKLRSEGSLSEVKEVLGWSINTRSFTVSLSTKKPEQWGNQIRSILKANRDTPSFLESLIGRLNHAPFIIPMSSHYLNRIRNLHRKHQCRKFINLTH